MCRASRPVATGAPAGRSAGPWLLQHKTERLRDRQVHGYCNTGQSASEIGWTRVTVAQDRTPQRSACPWLLQHKIDRTPQRSAGPWLLQHNTEHLRNRQVHGYCNTIQSTSEIGRSMVTATQCRTPHNRIRFRTMKQSEWTEQRFPSTGPYRACRHYCNEIQDPSEKGTALCENYCTSPVIRSQLNITRRNPQNGSTVPRPGE